MTSGQSEDEQPPERSFDQTSALDRMEAAAAEAIADLPDFPGFYVRTLSTLECTHEGEVDDAYVNYELSYQFSEEVSQQELVRETYTDLFREQWSDAGYNVHRDMQMGDDPPHYALEARRPDGINLWYRVAGLTVLKVQSGCVEAVDGFVPECLDPLPGVTKENDRASNECRASDVEYSEASSEPASDEAIAPFEDAAVISAPNGEDREGSEARSSYDGEL